MLLENKSQMYREGAMWVVDIRKKGLSCIEIFFQELGYWAE